MFDSKIYFFIQEYRYKIEQLRDFRNMSDLISANFSVYDWLIELPFFLEPIEVLEKDYVRSRKVFELHLKQTINEMTEYWEKFYGITKKYGVENHLEEILKEVEENEKESFRKIDFEFRCDIPEMLFNSITRSISELESNNSPVIKKLLEKEIISTYENSEETYPLPIYDNYDELKERIFYGYAYNSTDPDNAVMVIKNPLYDDSFPYSLETPGEPYDEILGGEDSIEDDTEGIAWMLRRNHARLSHFFFNYYFNGEKEKYNRFIDFPTHYEQAEFKVLYKENKLEVVDKGSVYLSQGTVYSELVKILVDKGRLSVSYNEAKRKIKGLTNNDFHRYKVYLNNKFQKATEKGELRVKLKLIKDITDKRGNPAFLLSISEKLITI